MPVETADFGVNQTPDDSGIVMFKPTNLSFGDESAYEPAELVQLLKSCQEEFERDLEWRQARRQDKVPGEMEERK